MINVHTWLTNATHLLKDAGIETARLDAIILLEDYLAKDRAWILANPEFKFDALQQASLKKLLNRRATHEPLAYVRGHCEFYGREYILTPAVLQPRPESETLIDLLKTYSSNGTFLPSRSRSLRIGDVGTGSGVLGITAALELPSSQVELLEIDKKAAAVAKINVDLFTLNTSVIISDLLAGSSSNFDVLLCNLPYIPDDYTINKAALHEPPRAIFGGKDGLTVYRRLFDQLKTRDSRPLLILTESLPSQHKSLRAIAQNAHYKELQTIDFVQVFQRHI